MIRFQTDINFERVLDVHDEYLVPLARMRRMLLDRQIDLSATVGDFILADSDHGPFATDRPVVMIDRSDGGFLHWRFLNDPSHVRKWLRNPALAAVMKISRYRSASAYNAVPDVHGEHWRRIRERMPGESFTMQDPSTDVISDADFEKLKMGAGYWAFDQCGPLAAMDGPGSGKRPIDVFCAISVDYRCAIISWHRRRALAQLQQAAGLRTVLGRGRVYSVEAFQNLMRQSRICVSPWGWGETCHRDYEALLAGAVLIKPKTDFIDSALPLDDRHYVACEPDFSDLIDQIRYVLDNWPDFEGRRQRLRQYILDARRPEVQADHWAKTLTEAVRLYV